MSIRQTHTAVRDNGAFPNARGDSLAEVAEQLARDGFSILPVRPCGKEPRSVHPSGNEYTVDDLHEPYRLGRGQIRLRKMSAPDKHGGAKYGHEGLDNPQQDGDNAPR